MTSAISTKMVSQVMLMVIIKSTHKSNLNDKVYLQSFIVLASLLYQRKMEYQVSFTDINSVKPVAVIG